MNAKLEAAKNTYIATKALYDMIDDVVDTACQNEEDLSDELHANWVKAMDACEQAENVLFCVVIEIVATVHTIPTAIRKTIKKALDGKLSLIHRQRLVDIAMRLDA